MWTTTNVSSRTNCKPSGIVSRTSLNLWWRWNYLHSTGLLLCPLSIMIGNRRSIACGAPPILLNVWRRHHCRPNQLHLLNSMSYQVLDNLTVHPTAQLGPHPWLALCNSDENIYWYIFVKLHTARPKCNSSKKGCSEMFVLKNRWCEEQAW